MPSGSINHLSRNFSFKKHNLSQYSPGRDPSLRVEYIHMSLDTWILGFSPTLHSRFAPTKLDEESLGIITKRSLHFHCNCISYAGSLQDLVSIG